MRYVTEDDFDEAWEYFHSNKEWFPHVRKFHIRNRLKWGQVIIQDNVIITQQQYKRTGPIGRHTINFGNEPRNVITQKGDYIIHQIISKNKGSGGATKVIKEYFEHVNANVYLTVRENNVPANNLYKKVGMKRVGIITWSQGKMRGNVWKYEQSKDNPMEAAMME